MLKRPGYITSQVNSLIFEYKLDLFVFFIRFRCDSRKIFYSDISFSNFLITSVQFCNTIFVRIEVPVTIIFGISLILLDISAGID